jgi:hypothetical protein
MKREGEINNDIKSLVHICVNTVENLNKKDSFLEKYHGCNPGKYNIN